MAVHLLESGQSILRCQLRLVSTGVYINMIAPKVKMNPQSVFWCKVAQQKTHRSGVVVKATVLITGAGGQLGRELVALAGSQYRCVAVDRSELDIADAGAVKSALADLGPQLVINAAAYTAVDMAESQAEAATEANAQGPANLAAGCARAGARLIHISTDFVFDGNASQPYRPENIPAPVSEYGRGKLAGEQAVLSQLPQALIIRTGWVYSIHGKNFVKTMLNLMAHKDELSVVADQVGTPTWARGLAQAVWAAARREQLSGIYHWSDAGVCSWYDFAVAICEEGVECGLLPRTVKIRPIPGTEYPTPAIRPAYSVLDKSDSWRDFGLEGVHWRVALRAMLKQLKEEQDE
jgi:dTDP-4-dehydrorhamnose reductase